MNRIHMATLGAATLVPVWTALGTWSIVLVDTRTGELAAASATCLTSLDLQQLTPVMVVGVGAATAQSAGDTTQLNRTYIRDRLVEGLAPSAILSGLASFDSGHQTRQYGMVDVQGRVTTFSGSGAAAWAGGRTGSFTSIQGGRASTIVYAVQGNILTGAPVVDRAVEALLSTPGDMAAKLMAAMEAARSMGGDGRCSCFQGPTACGSPPPSFTLSANIGYMLISRPGDTDGGHGVHRAGGAINQSTLTDLNSDRKPELFLCPTDGFSIQTFTNQTPSARSPFPTFGLSTSWNMGSSARNAVVIDVNGDGRLDLVDTNFRANTIGIRPGTTGVQFGAFTSFATAAGPFALLAASFDQLNGPDLAHLTSAGVSVRTHAGALTFNAATDIALAQAPRALLARDLDRDGNMDLIVAVTNMDHPIVIRGNGDGTFAPTPALETNSSQIIALAATDLDGDLDDDVVAILTGARSGTQVFRNDAGTLVPTAFYPVTRALLDLALGDVNGDSRLDLVTIDGSPNFHVMLGNGDGSFGTDSPVATGWGLAHVALADLDNDGDLDGVFNIAGTGHALTAVNRGSGRFDSGIGDAFGTYFMSLNVPNASEADPDPVLRLRQQYDAWRSARAGRVDGVQSLVVTPAYLPVSEQRALRLYLRDSLGHPAIGALTPRVETLVGTGRVTIGAPIPLGPGAFEYAIVGELAGGVPLRITIDDGERSTRLVPDPVLFVGTRCIADVDGNGGVTIDDLLAYLQAYADGLLTADLDDGTGTAQRDGGVTLEDLLYYLVRFENGC